LHAKSGGEVKWNVASRNRDRVKTGHVSTRERKSSPLTTYGLWRWTENMASDVRGKYCVKTGINVTLSAYRKRVGNRQSVFIGAGYIVYCSGERGGKDGGRKGQDGVGLKQAILARTAVRPRKFISDRLLKVTLELRGRARAVTFVVAYAPTGT